MSSHRRVRCVIEGCSDHVSPPSNRCAKHRREHGHHLLAQLDAIEKRVGRDGAA